MSMENRPANPIQPNLSQKEAERQRRIAELQDKIRKLEEEIADFDTRINSRTHSRREFLKTGSLALAGLLLTPSTSNEGMVKPLRTDIKLEKGTTEERTKEQILASLRIIEQGKYHEILNNAYLVSALYYSEDALKTMQVRKEPSATEEIITTIYPFITKEFREGYMKMLDGLIRDNEISKESSKPLDSIDSGHTVDSNHQDAVDLFIKEGSPVYAVSSGVVVLSENGWTTEEMSTSSMRGGNVVIIYNPLSKSFYRYAHMRETLPASGSFIQSGAKIGIVGNTGINASKPGHGDHLHLEINRYDKEGGVMRAVSARELRKKLETLN